MDYVITNSSLRKKYSVSVALYLFLLSVPALLFSQNMISGTVFNDQNRNGQRELHEPGLPNVMVSDGQEIVFTDEEGQYEFQAFDNSVLFVIKPSGWTTTVDENNIPKFYTILSSEGAGGSNYPGLPATGSISGPIDFALYPQSEPEDFRVLVFGDTQPRNLQEVNYIAHDSVQELIGIDAAFGLTLGDLVFDDLSITQSVNEVIGEIGIPWRHVIGNHDIDYSADTNWDARGSYLHTYGPSWYAFSWGRAHFVVVDNIRWIVEGDDRYYRTGLGDEQMMFIENFLDEVPDNEPVFFLMHIPWVNSTAWADESERDRLFRLLASHSNTVSFAAHTHRHYHDLIGSEYGWPGDLPHHLVSMGTVCGAWWAGAFDEYGIPHSMMQDGTPTGYAFLDITGTEWKLTYKAARRPSDFQMHISAPDEVSISTSGNIEVFANIFNALPDAEVEIRVGKSGVWQPMVPVEIPDPVYEAMRIRENMIQVNSTEEIPWRVSGGANTTPRHLWQAQLPNNLDTGAHTLYIRSTDRWNSYDGYRVIRITE